MIVRVQRWGNSLALRIPGAFASEMNLKPGSPVELTLADGGLVVKRERGCYTLEELLVNVTVQNRYREVDSGKRVGKEVW
jgi:antitoxin MazE